MIGLRFIGMFSSSSVGTKLIKLDDGTKYNLKYKKVVLESADIDYESIEKFNPAISSTLLNIQPMPFKSLDFGDQSTLNIKLVVELPEPNEEIDIEETKIDTTTELLNVMITDLSVKVKENLPVYSFTLDIPIEQPVKDIENMMKDKIIFSFDEMV